MLLVLDWLPARQKPAATARLWSVVPSPAQLALARHGWHMFGDPKATYGDVIWPGEQTQPSTEGVVSVRVVASGGHGRHAARVVRLEGGALALVYRFLPHGLAMPELHQWPGGQSTQAERVSPGW